MNTDESPVFIDMGSVGLLDEERRWQQGRGKVFQREIFTSVPSLLDIDNLLQFTRNLSYHRDPQTKPFIPS